MQSITRKCKPISSSYEVNGRTIQSCEEERDLGLLVDCDLTWRTQVCHQAARANKLLGYIRRNARYIRSTSTRRTLYLGLVRGHFAYATQVWAPQAIELISKLEKIQRRATKFILQLPFITEISYMERLISLDLLPVCYWHELRDMVFFTRLRIICSTLSSPSIVPVVRESARTTRASATIFVGSKRCRTTTYQKSFFIRTTRIWKLFSAVFPAVYKLVCILISVTSHEESSLDHVRT